MHETRTGNSRAGTRPRIERIGTLLVLLGLLFGFHLSALADDVLIVDGHTFEYLGVNCNEDGTSTWSYRVTSGSAPALSHWVLALDPALEASNVVTASEEYAVGRDKSTGLYGFKFDEGYEDGETREASFMLDVWYVAAGTRVGAQAGQDVEVGGLIPGPSAEVLAANEPPVANDDSAPTDGNASVGIDVLANDTDSDGAVDPTSVIITAHPASGTAGANPSTGATTYTPNPGSCGSDSFGYTVDDNNGATSEEAAVNELVLSRNRQSGGGCYR